MYFDFYPPVVGVGVERARYSIFIAMYLLNKITLQVRVRYNCPRLSGRADQYSKHFTLILVISPIGYSQP